MQTASLKSTTLQTPAAAANSLSTSEISLNGADVVQSIQEKGGKALKNLISRELVNDEDYYIIWDDSGQPIDVKLPEGYYPKLDFCTGLKEWKWDLSSLKRGIGFFDGCRQLKKFKSNLDSLTDGNYMFRNCSKLENFDTDLPSLIIGTLMFFNANSMKSFNAKIPKLQNGKQMFLAVPIKSFLSSLSSLLDGKDMFLRFQARQTFSRKHHQLSSHHKCSFNNRNYYNRYR